MITRDEAATFVASDGSDAFPSRLELADTVVALHDDVARLTRMQEEMRGAALGHIAERDAAHAEVATLTTLLRLAEASVALLRDDLAARERERDQAVMERDRLTLEVRCIRAAESPGTDDEALAGMGWEWAPGFWEDPDPRVNLWSPGYWLHRPAATIVVIGTDADGHTLTYDEMRAVVPPAFVPTSPGRYIREPSTGLQTVKVWRDPDGILRWGPMLRVDDPLTACWVGPADAPATQPRADEDPLHPTGRCRCGGEGRCEWCLMNAIREDRDAARLELRRLRAAEAPGTDDEAFEGTGWSSVPERGFGDGYVERAEWRHESGAVVMLSDLRSTGLMIYAMRAAVPESV